MSTGHSYVFYDVPFMSPAQFSTGVLSIFDMSSLSCLQSLQISYFHSLHPKACIFLPPGACYLAPSTLSILLGLPEFFLIHKSKHASFLPKGPPPHLPPPLLAISLLLFMVAFPHCGPRIPASHLLSLSLHTLFLPGNASSHFFCPPARPLASRSRSFLWDAFPDLPRESGSFLLPCSHLYCGSH